MRIAHVVCSLDPDGGGPPTFVPRLATALARAGHDNHIYAQEDDGRQTVIDDFLAQVKGNELWQAHRSVVKGKLARMTASGVVSAVERDLRQTDIVHIHGIWEPMLVRIARAARAAGTPYIISPHGMLDPYSLSQKGFKKKLAMALVYRTMLDHAAGLHTLNRDEADLIRPLGLRAELITVALGLDIDELQPLPERGQLIAELPQLDGKKFFLFLSRLHHKKGLDLLAPAYKKFLEGGGDWHMVIAGPDGGAQGPFEQQLAELACADKVHLIGSVWGEKKLAALADADAFILPSRQEGFSQAITEAMLSKLPIIATENCHFPEVAEEKTGLLTQLDVDEIAQAMLSIANDPAGAEAMGEAGHRLVLERFTWPKVALQMVDAYSKCIADSSASELAANR